MGERGLRRALWALLARACVRALGGGRREVEGGEEGGAHCRRQPPLCRRQEARPRPPRTPPAGGPRGSGPHCGPAFRSTRSYQPRFSHPCPAARRAPEAGAGWG